MRITGYRMIDLSAAGTANAQSAVADASAEVTSGLRVTKPSDDPTAYAAAERAKIRKNIADSTGAGVQASRDRLDETDGALATLGDIVSQIRALAVQGSNATYNASDRAELGAQVRALFTSAVGAANTRSSDGEYLLAGSTSLTAPFDPAGGYTGDANGRSIPAGENAMQMATVPGSRLTATYGVDVLPLMVRVASALSTNNLASLQIGLGELDTAVKQVGLTRTVTGGAMQVLDATKSASDALSAHLTTEVSRNIEVDTVAAASDLAKASQSLEASRLVTSHLVALLDPRSA